MTTCATGNGVNNVEARYTLTEIAGNGNGQCINRGGGVKHGGAALRS